MNVLNSFIDQSKQIWGRTSVGGRIGGVVGLVLVVTVVTAVGIWSAQPQYVTLASNLSPQETADFISQLDAANIPNRMNAVGSGVLVPRQELNSARVAVGDLLGAGPPDDAGLDGSMWGDPSRDHYRFLKRKEAELEATIARMRSIRSAEVHIAQPKWTPFIRHQQPTTASVVLGVRPGALFSQEQAATIVALVSRSVEGLSEESVTISDLSGRTWTGQSSLSGSGMLSRLDYRVRREAQLAAKAQAMLESKLGPDKSIVRVSAEVDFTETERTQTTIDPNSKVKISEIISTRSGYSPDTSGVAGVASNSGGITQNQTTAVAAGGESEDLESKFEVGKTEETVTLPGGDITRLTVSALVDLGTTTADASQANSPTDLTKEQIEGIIKTAVGFDASRNDQIEVVITELMAPADPLSGGLATVQKWEFYNQLVRNASLGLAAVVALIIGLLTVRKLQPITLSGRQSEDAQRREALLADLSRRVQENPETVSRILATWLDEDPKTTDDSSDSDPDTLPMRRRAA